MISSLVMQPIAMLSYLQGMLEINVCTIIGNVLTHTG